MQSASLGDWIRRRRRTLDLTQADLAAEVGCAPITIRKIEADERRPSRVMAERIAEALGLDGEDLDRFVQTARALRSPIHLPAPAAAASFAPPGLLPHPPNTFIGRTAELEAVLDRLRLSGGPARLLTVTGPPGVGKTRFAIEVAARVERKFDVPAVFVDLTVASSAEDVPAVIAAAVATPTASTADVLTLTVAALRRTPVLLVVDNVEHVIDAAGTLSHLVEQCPDLVCLATSRQPLELYGEHVVPLAPFDLDDPVDAASAVELFTERAAATGVALPVDADEVVAALCRTLDGLPLALELAALRVRHRPPADLLGDLQGWTSVLRASTRDRGERGRSASGAVRWSFEQLSTAAQDVLVHASVFAGPFTTEVLAELMATASPDVSPVTAALDESVDAALVAADADDGFRLLFVVRAFGREELLASGRDGAVRAAHAELVARAVEDVSTGIDAWPERATLDQLACWDPEARAALAWCFDAGDRAVGRRIFGAVIVGWHFAGHTADALRWAAIARDSAIADGAPDRYRYDYYLAVARWAAGEPGARDLMAAAADGARVAGDETWFAEALGMEQLLSLAEGDLAGADALTSACLEAADHAGGEWQLLTQLRATTLAVIGGRLLEARDHLSAASTLVAEHPSSWGRGTTLGVEGDVLLAEGDARAAIDRYLAAAETFWSAGAVVYAIARVAGVANACTALGEARVGARLYGLIDAWNNELGTPLHPTVQFSTAVHQAAGRNALGAAFDDAWGEGRTLSRDLETVASEVAAIGLDAAGVPMTERSFDEVVSDLTRIVDISRSEGSALGIFPAMYRTVTITVGEGTAAGVFDDPIRVRQLVAVFADLYIDAYDTHRSGGDAPLSWRLAFDEAERGRCSICEHLLLGMNAHINLDLGIAAALVSTPDDHGKLRGDFDRVNVVLFALLDEFQRAVGEVSPWMSRLDRLGLGFDEAMMRVGIGGARSQAWEFSERLVAAPESDRPALIADQDLDARRIGRLLRAPWSPLHLANRVVAARECRDRRQVIDVLAAARIDVGSLLA